MLPATDEEVAALLAWCEENRVAVIALRGGTSVVGGVDPDAGRFRAAITVDLRRMDALIDLDEVSQVATLGAGVTGPDAEELLGSAATPRPLPQSFRFATIGGFAVTRPRARPRPATGGSTTWSRR